MYLNSILEDIETQVNVAEEKDKPVKVSPNHTTEQLVEIAADCVRLILQKANPNQLPLEFKENEIHS